MDARTVLQTQLSFLCSKPVVVSAQLLGLPIPIAEIVIGALYLDSCPLQRYIPIYLVVTGVIALSFVLQTFLPSSLYEGNERIRRIWTVWLSVISLFNFCFLIAGSVWIYSIYKPNYNPAEGPYCDKTLYLFAFWMTTLIYILAALLFIVVCCVPCIALLMATGEQGF
ncbi:transmembrane protein 272-like [Alosa pseudoharengus]|uniref:transmembrane protein 272-like n=1 Tax=Alosa pseudoharengus TaxID=34774 RepID=UPI003F89C87B